MRQKTINEPESRGELQILQTRALEKILSSSICGNSNELHNSKLNE